MKLFLGEIQGRISGEHSREKRETPPYGLINFS